MRKTLIVSEAAHQMPIRVGGEFTAQLGKRLTCDDVIQLLVREQDEARRKVAGAPNR